MHYHIVLTRQCILNCSYCHGGEEKTATEVQYSLDDLEQFLSQDSCNGNVLTEHYCTYDSEIDVYYRDTLESECYIGCEDGACIQDGILDEGYACCEKTIQGWGCYETLETECDTSFKMTPVSCEQTSYCQRGCCYDTDYGYCEYYSTESQCSENGGQWSDDPNCEIPECERGCCTLGNEFRFMTEARCDIEAGYMGVSVNFDHTITNELEYIMQGPLRIDYAGPNWERKVYELPGEINLYVHTSKPATCTYLIKDSSNEPAEFFYTGDTYHNQDLSLNEGKYEFDISCTDGNETAETIIGFSVILNEEGILNLEVAQGWNLIRGFVEPYQIIGGDIEQEDIKVTYALVPTIQEYARVYPEAEWEKLKDINDEEILSWGFWVYSNKAGMMKYRLYDDWVLPLDQRQISTGWNFVGITGDMAPEYDGEELKDLVGDCNIEMSYVFEQELQEWREFPLHEEFGVFAVGYTWVIKVSDDCNLGRSDEIAAPPELPGIVA